MFQRKVKPWETKKGQEEPEKGSQSGKHLGNQKELTNPTGSRLITLEPKEPTTERVQLFPSNQSPTTVLVQGVTLEPKAHQGKWKGTLHKVIRLSEYLNKGTIWSVHLDKAIRPLSVSEQNYTTVSVPEQSNETVSVPE